MIQTLVMLLCELAKPHSKSCIVFVEYNLARSFLSNRRPVE